MLAQPITLAEPAWRAPPRDPQGSAQQPRCRAEAVPLSLSEADAWQVPFCQAFAEIPKFCQPGGSQAAAAVCESDEEARRQFARAKASAERSTQKQKQKQEQKAPLPL